MQRSNQSRTAHRNPVTPPGLSHGKGDPLVASSGEETRESQDSLASPAEVRGGVYVISVAAKILDMHPPTLRKYERLGLVTPTRSMGMLRLYSAEDVVRVRLIKYMVESLGMNLAGVEFALAILSRVMDVRERIHAMSHAEALSQFVAQELEGMLSEMDGIFPDNPSRV